MIKTEYNSYSSNQNKNTRNYNQSYRESENERDKKILENYEALDPIGYVNRAEKIMCDLAKQRQIITTNKLRNILTMLREIQKSVLQKNEEEKLNEDLCGRLQYYKMRCAYEAGRDREEKQVKAFMEKSQIIALVEWIGDDKKKFLLYCHYVEALVAFHKYYVKDK